MLPTSPTGNRGFTLLELLLVITILGMMIGLVSFAIPDRNDKTLETETRRIAGLIALSRELAVYRNRDIGLQLQQGQYQFLQYHQGSWQDIEDQPKLGLRILPEGLRLELQVEQQPIALRKPQDSLDPTPQIQILSDGQQSEFSLTLIDRTSREQRQLRGEFTGELSLREPGA